MITKKYITNSKKYLKIYYYYLFLFMRGEGNELTRGSTKKKLNWSDRVKLQFYWLLILYLSQCFTQVGIKKILNVRCVNVFILLINRVKTFNNLSRIIRIFYIILVLNHRNLIVHNFQITSINSLELYFSKPINYLLNSGLLRWKCIYILFNNNKS